MPIVWTESDTLKLVTLYSQHECLRNPLHPNFKNKLSRYKAYKQITDCMNIRGLTVCDCIKRITHVKAQYCYELSKISAAISCETFYKPTASWFPIIHQLFFPIITRDCINNFWKTGRDKKNPYNDYHRNEMNELTRSTSMELDLPGKNCGCPYTNCHCERSHITKSRTRSKNVWTRPEGEKTTAEHSRLYPQKATQIDVGSNTKKNIATEHTAQTDVSYFKTKCTTCQVCLEDNVTVKNHESLSLKSDSKDDDVNDVLTEDSKGRKKTHDEFDMFGKSIAFQLRNIDFEIAIKLEKRIQDLIAQERLDNMKLKCSECYSSSNCSECKVIQKEMVCSCGLPVIMIKTDQSCEFDGNK